MKTSALLFLIVILFSGCSVNPEEPADTVSGIYFLHGTQIDSVFTRWPWPGEFPTVRSIDTTQISFTLNVRRVEAKQDTIQFHGLLGVNAGYRRPWRNLTYILSPSCTYLARDCAYAKLDGEEFIVNINNLTTSRSAPHYYGIGSLKNGKMTLNSLFIYRNSSSTYSLEGTKIE